MMYSVRTHGVGILANVMNALYKFIRKQINNFCRNFLLDETIKNMLFREDRLFQREKENLNGMYPYERAIKLGRNVRDLVDEENYLETIRKRIT